MPMMSLVVCVANQRNLLAQCVFGAAVFAPSLLLPRASYWELVPAVLHGSLVAGWLLRPYLRRLVLTNL